MARPQVLVEPRVACSVDLAHPPCPEGTEDLVEEEGVTGGEGSGERRNLSSAPQDCRLQPAGLHDRRTKDAVVDSATRVDQKGGTKVALDPTA